MDAVEADSLFSNNERIRHTFSLCESLEEDPRDELVNEGRTSNNSGQRLADRMSLLLREVAVGVAKTCFQPLFSEDVFKIA